MDPLWRTTEAAAYIGRPVGTLRQWRHKGIGPPCFKVEGLIMYRKSAVEAWLAAQESADRVGGAA